MEIKELKKKIEEQKEKNINLFGIFQYKLHEREMQPLIEEWREGSKLLKSMFKELHELEEKERSNTVNMKEDKKVFVNGFGEATRREITCSTYEKAQKRHSKAMLSFIGG
ncbi:MAG: hypothetical protein WD512_18560 [Candidatus Paceibacterota bacterium]